MKIRIKLTIFLLALFGTIALTGQTQQLNNYYNDVDQFGEAFKFSIPGFLVRTGLKFALKDEENVELKKSLGKLIKGIKRMKVVVIENPARYRSVSALSSDLRSKEQFEELVRVKDDGEFVNVLIRESDSGKVIKNLVVLVEGKDESVMVSMKTNLKHEDLKGIDWSSID